VPHKNSKNAGFGGMKKGFLFSSCSKSSEASDCKTVMPADCSQKSEVENIPLISANKDLTVNQHRFDEVQQAMEVNGAFAMNKGDIVYINVIYQLNCIFYYTFNKLYLLTYLLT